VFKKPPSRLIPNKNHTALKTYGVAGASKTAIHSWAIFLPLVGSLS